MKLEIFEKLHDEAMIAQRNPVKIATIAAPFAAAGMSPGQALLKANLLLAKAIGELDQEWNAEILRHPSLFRDLAGIKELLNRKTDKTVRRCLLEALPLEEAAEVWRRALAGEKVFTREIQKKLAEHQGAKNIAAEAARRASNAAKKAKRRKKSLHG